MKLFMRHLSSSRMRFKYRKVTPEIVERMKKLRAEGYSQKEIAEEIGVTQSTVCYWINKEYRKKAIRRAKERLRKFGDTRDKEKWREYIRRYIRERYWKDERFRERVKAYMRKYMREYKKK